MSYATRAILQLLSALVETALLTEPGTIAVIAHEAGERSRHRGNETGQSTVELAFIVPSLALLVFGVLVLGQVIIAQYAVQSAAREGARVGAEVGVQGNPFGIAQGLARDRVEQVLEDRGLDPADAVISFAGSNTNYERGGVFKVKVTYDYPLPVDLPLLRPIFGLGGRVTLEADASYRIQLYKARWR